MKCIRPALASLAILFVGSDALGQVGTDSAPNSFAGGAIVRFSGHEAISAPFEVDVEFAANDLTLNLLSAVGQHLGVTLARGWTVHGMIESIELTGNSAADATYRVRLVPTLARLKHSTNSRTFYEKTSAEIIAMLLDEHGVAPQATEFRLTRPPPRRDITMQYQESDLALLSRLAEEDGIHYHFEHSAAGHKLVFSDANNGFPAVGRLRFSTEGTPAVQAFNRGQAMHPGRVRVGDYDWRDPANTQFNTVAQSGVFAGEIERLHPTRVMSGVESQNRANDRLAAHIAQAQRCEGITTYAGLHAGQRHLLTGHFRSDFNQEYLITEVEFSQGGRGGGTTFRCVPSSFVYRPEPVTPRPVIAGALPAIVVAPSGERQYVDEFGRVRVRFPWRSSDIPPATLGDGGWVKVAQIATGRGMTSQWLPHAGDEVLVAFEHGDPARPVVIGGLYNGIDRPPTGLPDNRDHTVVFRALNVDGAPTGELSVINTAGGESLLLGGARDLMLQAGGELAVNAANANLRGSTNVLVAAGGGLVLEGAQDLRLSGGADLGVNATRNVSITSGLDLSVKGGRRFVIQGNSIELRAGAHAIVIDSQGIKTSAPINSPPPAKAR